MCCRFPLCPFLSIEDLEIADHRFSPVWLALGSGILFTYPEIATIAGVQGLVVYALSSALPLLAFGFLGPIIRRKCPEGFVLTEWTRQRYGVIAALYLSILTYAQLTRLGQDMRLMKNGQVDHLVHIHGGRALCTSADSQCVNRSQWSLGCHHSMHRYHYLHVYVIHPAADNESSSHIALGGFRISFMTDNIQGTMVVGLIIIGVITIGVETKVDRSLVDSSNLLNASLLGWQLIYILPVAIGTNVFFISGFWLRTFASKTDRDLRIGTSIATVTVAIILTLVGVSGLLAAWTGAWPGDPPQAGSIAFFLLLEQLPAWVVGIVIVMTVSLSTAAFDSLQSAMVSTGSNDLFRNRLNLWWIRLAVVLLIFPVAVVALKSPSILQIYLVSDLVSATSIPVLVIGLSSKCSWWRGFEVVVGGLGGLLTVFVFGTIYYGNAKDGANLLVLEQSLYVDDWSAFGKSTES